MKFPLLMNADCLQAMCVIPEGSVDLILCDLPYGTTACKWDSVIPFEPLWREYWRVLKPNGAVVLTAAQPFTTQLIASQIDRFKYCWVWEKTMATGGMSAKTRPLRAHEDIAVFSNGRTTYNPQKTPGAAYSRKEGSKKESVIGGRAGGYVTENPSGERMPRSVIKIPNPNHASLHPTQKPVALMEYLIRTYTNECETVLDNCMGSGTTGVACKNTGRNFIGIERDPEYFRIASERIE